jgi:Zn-dependent protease
LEIHELTALGRGIRVATRIHGFGTFAGDDADAGHICAGRLNEPTYFVKGCAYEKMAGMGLISLLAQEPLLFVVLVSALVLTLSVHEAAHAWVGSLLGDMTAKRLGRLTLNPLAHIDPVGFLMVLFVGFGYAKPVPFNPYNLRDQRWGPALIAAAGPASNLVLGVLCAVTYGILAPFLGAEAVVPWAQSNLLLLLLAWLGLINFALMSFNFIPIPPLDGSKVLLALLAGPQFARARTFLESQGPSLLLLLIFLDILLNIGIFSWIFQFASGLFLLFS